jgi:hypothetical protein
MSEYLFLKSEMQALGSSAVSGMIFAALAGVGGGALASIAAAGGQWWAFSGHAFFALGMGGAGALWSAFSIYRIFARVISETKPMTDLYPDDPNATGIARADLIH